LIPGGGAFFFQISGPTPPTPPADTRRRVFLLKRWY